ncbi:MAG: HEAT repeat domain-containing protein [Spirochaetales bacterium]|nr:HEAT repeat domain-containing protein [Spirochaetales bacterium]
MLDFLRGLSLYWMIIPVLFLGALIFLLIRRLRFIGKLKRIERGEIFTGDLKKSELIRYYDLVEKRLADKDSPLYGRREIGDLWVDKLIQTGGVKWYNLIVKHFPGEYLYPCFLQSLTKKKLFRVFRENLDQDDIFTLEILGKSCGSTPFDGKAASELLGEEKKILRKMASSSSADVRFFAYNILVHYEDDLSRSAVMHGFSDSHRPVRILLVEKTSFVDRNEAYRTLEHLLLHDPGLSVRTAAAKRINRDFKDLKKIDPQSMTTDQALHYISLMENDSDRDEKIALSFLESEEKSLVREAALFLEKKGVLQRFCSELHLGDGEDYERKIRLLGQAVSVNVTGFFTSYPWSGDDALLGAARLLKGRGDLRTMEKLASAVFAREPYASEFSLEIYRAVAESVDGTASDECHRIKALELKKHQDDPLIMEILLTSIPREREFYYMNDLFYLLEKGQDFCRLLVRDRLSGYEPALILTELNDQLLNEENPVRFRADVLIILIGFHLDYTLQMVLEHLPLLDEDELVRISPALEKYDREKLSRLSEVLFKSCDGDIHRSLIYSLPLDTALEYEDRIVSFLGSRDWDIRRAVLVKLYALGKLTVNSGLPLLNDPDDRVRTTAVSLLMDLDEEDVREVVKDLLFSDGESDKVKKAIITGLIKSNNPGSLDLLFDFLTREESYRPKVLELLFLRSDSFYVEGLIRNFVKGESSLREEFKPLFIHLGVSMEEPMAELLKRQSTEARKMIEEILEEGGYMDRLAVLMKSPEPEQRRRAVETLVSLETRDALKAALMAAEDPDKAVRVAVIRALEKLNTKAGAALIQELTEDPDKKVRTFALWARERLESRNRG